MFASNDDPPHYWLMHARRSSQSTKRVGKRNEPLIQLEHTGQDEGQLSNRNDHQQIVPYRGLDGIGHKRLKAFQKCAHGKWEWGSPEQWQDAGQVKAYITEAVRA